MGLLAAVAVPALKGLTGSGGRKQALSQVMGALEIARNTAISSGTNAAVIFPDNNFKQGDAYKYRSMAVVAWNPTNTNLITMVGSWIVLPQGIALFPNSISALPQTSNISIRILTTTTSGTFRGICFQSDGALDESLFPVGNPLPKIALFEGTVDDTAAKKNSKTTMFETVNLTRYTGRAIPTVITNEP
jgi:Tfp pilus assembly protein FimT